MEAQGMQGAKGRGAGPDVAHKEDLARQEEIFESRKDELLDQHPGKFILVCGGKVFVGDSDAEVIAKAEVPYPDRAVFMSGREEFFGGW